MCSTVESGRETILSKIGLRDSEDMTLLRRGLLYTFFLGLCAHGFAFLHLSISHDAVFDFYDALAAHQHQIGLGRILEPLYRELTASGLLMPWSVGLAALFWIGVSVFFVCRLFHLSGKAEVFLTAGIMTVNISVTSVTAAYTPWLAADMFALLLAVAGVYFWHIYADHRQKEYLLYGMFAICVSLSIYQCYFAVAVVLMILLSMQDLIEDRGAARVFADGMAGVGMLTAGGALYYLLMKGFCRLAGTPLEAGAYDSVTNLWDNKEPVYQRAIYCLKEGMTHFFAKDENIYPYPVIWGVNLLILSICVCLAVRLVRQKNAQFEKGGGKNGMAAACAAGNGSAFCGLYDAAVKHERS